MGEFLLPHFLAGPGIECNHIAVEATEHQLAVGIRGTAVDRIAARHRHRALILLRGVFPQHLATVILRRQVDGEHVVRIRTDHVHDAADHQRLAFVAARGVGFHLPRHLQILDVVAIDFGQQAMPGSRPIPPQLSALLALAVNSLSVSTTAVAAGAATCAAARRGRCRFSRCVFLAARQNCARRKHEQRGAAYAATGRVVHMCLPLSFEQQSVETYRGAGALPASGDTDVGNVERS